VVAYSLVKRLFHSADDWGVTMTDEGQITIRPADRAGDLGWIVMANTEAYAGEYGWEASSFEALAARIVDGYAQEHDPAHAAAWIAELDAGARGRGVGTALVQRCLEFARAAGYERMKLWTNDPLVAARHVYLSHGFRLVEREPHHSFGVDLVGETYELDLSPA
jgi:GNAT superfamily N-acetyltransferase